MVGEEVAQRLAEERRGARALVEEADGGADHVRCAFLDRTPHHDGPTGPLKVPAGAQLRRAVDRQRQLRQRPAGRAEEHGAAGRRVEGRVVARADERRRPARRAGSVGLR